MATRITHALVVHAPTDTVKTESKKKKVDLAVVRQQQEVLMSTLREAGCAVAELAPEQNANSSTLAIGDAAVVAAGVALIARPAKHPFARLKEVRAVLQDLCDRVEDCPERLNNSSKANVVLNAQDVLFTGKEFFVATRRKNGTNVEGAMVVARTWPDWPVQSIPLSSSAPPLLQLVARVSPNVLAVSGSPESKAALDVIAREAVFRYRTLTVEDPLVVGSLLSLNDRLVFRQELADPKFATLQEHGIQLWALNIDELSRLVSPFTRLCLLVDRPPKPSSVANSKSKQQIVEKPPLTPTPNNAA